MKEFIEVECSKHRERAVKTWVRVSNIDMVLLYEDHAMIVSKSENDVDITLDEYERIKKLTDVEYYPC